MKKTRNLNLKPFTISFKRLISLVLVTEIFVGLCFLGIRYKTNPLVFMIMIVGGLCVGVVLGKIWQSNDYRKQIINERIKSNLMRSISHDIRTPLTSISGISELLSENYDYLDDKVKRKMLKGLSEDTQWLTRIVENVLAVTRINEDDSSNLDMSLELAEEVVESAVTKMRKRFPGRIIITEATPEPNLVWMDPILIEHVLINLIENSLLHAQNADYVKIRIVESLDAVVFEVEDNGIGVDEFILKRKVDFSGKRRRGDSLKKNLGLGLSVCKTIIEAHKAEFGVRKIKSGGAVFWFSLPKKADKGV